MSPLGRARHQGSVVDDVAAVGALENVIEFFEYPGPTRRAQVALIELFVVGSRPLRDSSGGVARVAWDEPRLMRRHRRGFDIEADRGVVSLAMLTETDCDRE